MRTAANAVNLAADCQQCFSGCVGFVIHRDNRFICNAEKLVTDEQQFFSGLVGDMLNILFRAVDYRCQRHIVGTVP